MQLARLYQRKWLLIDLPLAVLGAALAAWLWISAFPMPPGTVTFTAGDANGAYYRNAQRYVSIFASHGITLEVQASAGSQQNLDRLRQPAAPSDLAFIQGGFGYLGASFEGAGRGRIETLANVDVEPVWIFSTHRDVESLSQLQGLRVAVGPQGSGNRRVGLRLLEQVRLGAAELQLSDLSGTAAAQALRDGRIDVVIMVSSLDSAVVRAMLAVPGVRLANLRRATAITERNPYLEPRLLPRASLGPQQPPRDMPLLSTSASLVAREGLHPAIKRLAIAAAMEVHAGGGPFHRAGDFPSLDQIDFPTAAVSRGTLQHGLPWLERVLPFWWAQVVERLLLIVLPVTVLTLWVSRVLSAWLRWWLESRVNRWYGELKFIENDLGKADVSGLDVTRFLQRLQAIDRAMMAFAAPRELMQRCYMLHQHIEFVRRRLYVLRGR